MRAKIILLILPAIVLVTSVWLWRYGFIEVVVDGAGTDTVSYTVTDTNGITTDLQEGGRIKKLVRRGTYQVHIKSGNSAAFQVVRTGGLFTTTSIHTDLRPEKERTFVGDNPGPCMFMKANILASFSCGSTFTRLDIHQPATSVLPTYTAKSGSPHEGDIEDVLDNSEGTIMLLKASALSEGQGAPHTAYLYTDGHRLDDGVALRDLDEDDTYKLISYKNGFLVHDATLSRILFYETRRAKPSTITLPKPKTGGLRPKYLSAKGGALVLLYSSATQGLDGDDDEAEGLKDEVVIMNGSDSRSFKLGTIYFRTLLCGDQQLCALGNDGLDVYDIAGTKAELTMHLAGVMDILQTDENLLVVNSAGVIELDVNKQAGYFQLSFGPQQYCGLRASGKTYIVCVVDLNSKKIALKVDPNKPVSDAIDKKILELQKLIEVESTSVYDKFIYISPNYGELRLNMTDETTSYDPERQQKSRTAINNAIDKLGINRSIYTIINTLD